MNYGVIVSVFAIVLVSATLLKSTEAFRPNNSQVPNDNAPVVNPNNSQVPNDNAPVVTILASSSYTDNLGFFNIIGEVKNISYKTLKFVNVNASISDSSNRTLDRESRYTSLEELRPQQKSNFHIVFPDQLPIDQSTTYTLTVLPSEQRIPKLPQLQLNLVNSRSDSPDNFLVEGQVINQGNQPANYVKVSGSFYDINNQLVDVKNVYTQPSSLQPGESARFEIAISRPSLPQIASVFFDVQSKEYSSVSMGQNIAVTPALSSAIPSTPQLTGQQGSLSPAPGSGFACGPDTHLNKKGQCVPDRESTNNNNKRQIQNGNSTSNKK